MEIQIISGFLGAGKTTFLNQYLPCLPGKTAIIENEFGDVGVDGTLLPADIPVREINAGCICCTLAIDFLEGILEIIETFQPDRILIEPSGVAKLSEIIMACERVKKQAEIKITKKINIIDAVCCEEYMEDFGNFYSDQIEHADLLLLSHVDEVSEEEKEKAISRIREVNQKALLYEEDWRKLGKEELLYILQKVEKEELFVQEKENVSFLPNQIFSHVTLKENGIMNEEEIQCLLEGLKSLQFGQILRVKGTIPAAGGGAWEVHLAGKSCHYFEKKQADINCIIVIGCGLNKRELRKFIYSFGEE